MNPIAHFRAADGGVHDVVIDTEFPGKVFPSGILVQLLQIVDIGECLVA